MDERDPVFYSSEGDYSSSSSIFAVRDHNETLEFNVGSGGDTSSLDLDDFFEYHYSPGDNDNINVTFVPLTDDEITQEPSFQETQNILEVSQEDTSIVEDNGSRISEINVGDCTNIETSTLQDETGRTHDMMSINKSKLDIKTTTQEKQPQKLISETAIVTRSRARLREVQLTISALEQAKMLKEKWKLSLRPRNARGLVEKKKK